MLLESGGYEKVNICRFELDVFCVHAIGPPRHKVSQILRDMSSVVGTWLPGIDLA